MMPRPQPVKAYSKDTKNMLDKMMKDVGLPQAEQRRLRQAVAAGPSAPIARRRPGPASANAAPQHRYEDLLQGVPINPMMRLPGAHRKSQAAILREHGGTMERDQFRGGLPAKDRTVMVTALQQQMEFGRTLPGPSADPKPRPAPSRSMVPKSSEDGLRDSIVTEIDERREFLETMRAAGRSGEHESAIKGQIAERLNDLKRLDALMSDE